MSDIATGWPSVPIDQVCTAIVDCVNRTAPVVPGPTPYRMIRTTNVRDGFIDVIDNRFVDEDTFKKWTRRQRPLPGDVILTREAPLGEVGIVRPGSNIFLGQRLVSYRADPNLLDARYLLYYLRSDVGRAQVMALGSGATVAHMRVPDAKNLKLPLPPLSEQRRIGEVLGAYDDLIEVNRRRVALLEEMSRRLFDEWFVRFRFPGHERASTSETREGSLPEGWAQRRLADVCSMLRGRSYRSIDLADTGGMPFVNLKCMLRDGGFKPSGIKRYTGPYKPQHLVTRGDLVMAVTDMTQDRRVVGRIARIPLLDEPESIISMDLVKVVPGASVNPVFLYSWLKYTDFGVKAAQNANGANVLHLSPSAVADFGFPEPERLLQEAFARHVEPKLGLSENLAIGELRLAGSRDLLLPRLISGHLSVAGAERELARAA